MKVLQVVQGNAITAYKNADEFGKKILADLFGKDKLELSITERVKTFENACEVLGIDPDLGLSCSKSGAYKEIDNISAYAKIIIIVKALNEGWKPNWNDDIQYKWYPWMKYDSASSSFRFFVSDVDYSYAFAGSGVRLSSKKLSDYFGTQFTDLISQHLLSQ